MCRLRRLRLRLRANRFGGSGSGSDQNVSAPAAPHPCRKPILLVKIGETWRHSDVTHGWPIMIRVLIFWHKVWNCCPERYGRFQREIPSTSGAICEKPQGALCPPPPSGARVKSLKTVFLKRSLIGCDVKLTYTENRSRDYHWPMCQPLGSINVCCHIVYSIF